MNYDNKKLIMLCIILSAIIIAMAFITRCSSEVEADNKRMVLISNEQYGQIVYDKKTNVEYWKSFSFYNYGNLTLLVDENGNPLIYKGE